MPRYLFVAFWVMATLLMVTCAAYAQDTDPVTSSDEPASDVRSDNFQDEADPIEVAAQRTESDAFRIKAAALFAHGRVLLQRSELDGALRRIQRAWRYDPALVPIWDHIIPLARRTERFEELGRYAVLAAERQPKNPDLMVQLAALVAEQGEFDRAVALYESALELMQEDKLTADQLLARWETARLCLLSEQYQRAADHSAFVQKVLDSPQDHQLDDDSIKELLKNPSKTYRLFAESYLQAEMFEQAEQTYRKVYAKEEHQLEFHLARILAEQEMYDEALVQLEQYFDAKTSVAGAGPYRLYNRIVKETNTSDDEATKVVLAKLTTLQENDAANQPLGSVTARALLDEGRHGDAAMILKELFLLEATDSSYVGLIEAYTELKEVRPLLEILSEATGEFETPERFSAQTEPIAKNAKLLKELADLAREQQEAEEPIEHAAFAVAWIALQGDSIEIADELFEQALGAKDADKTDLLKRYGLKMYLQEHQTRAQELLRELLQQKDISKDEKTQAHFYLSRSLERDGKTEEALTSAKRAAVLDRSAMMRSQIGWILYHAKRYEPAETEYVRLIDRFEKDKSAATRESLREARMILSNICVLQKKLPEAEEWLEQVLDEFPEDIGAYNDLGYLWADQKKNLNHALAMTQKAAAAEPDNYAYLDSLGWSYFRLGRLDDAARELEKASDVEDPDAVVLDHLAQVYAGLKRIEDAVKTWQRALQVVDKEDNSELYESIVEHLKQYDAEKESD